MAGTSGRSGGSRPNAGRPSGAKNKATIERELSEKSRPAPPPGVGGRRAGSRNKATIAKEAAVKFEEAKFAGKKLAKDYLEDFLVAFAGMAARHQPLPDGMAVPSGRQPDEAKFEKWATLALVAAKELAKYQSPQFRAILAPAPPPETPAGSVKRRFTLAVFDGELPARPIVTIDQKGRRVDDD